MTIAVRTAQPSTSTPPPAFDTRTVASITPDVPLVALGPSPAFWRSFERSLCGWGGRLAGSASEGIGWLVVLLVLAWQLVIAGCAAPAPRTEAVGPSAEASEIQTAESVGPSSSRSLQVTIYPGLAGMSYEAPPGPAPRHEPLTQGGPMGVLRAPPDGPKPPPTGPGWAAPDADFGARGIARFGAVAGELSQELLAGAVQAALASGAVVGFVVTETETGPSNAERTERRVASTPSRLTTDNADAVNGFETSASSISLPWGGAIGSGGTAMSSVVERMRGSGVNWLHWLGGGLIAAGALVFWLAKSTRGAAALGVAGLLVIGAGTVSAEHPEAFVVLLALAVLVAGYLGWLFVRGQQADTALTAIVPAVERAEDAAETKSAIAAQAGRALGVVRGAVRRIKRETGLDGTRGGGVQGRAGVGGEAAS